MIRTFCDCCGNEMAPHELRRVSGQHERGQFIINVEVMTGLQGRNETGRTMNSGDICRNCIFDAVASLDTRDKPAMPFKGRE